MNDLYDHVGKFKRLFGIIIDMDIIKLISLINLFLGILNEIRLVPAIIA